MKISRLTAYPLLYMAALAIVAIALTGYLASRQAAAFADFTVSNSNDSGAGSLRQAITDANAAGGGNINFVDGISGIIDLQTALPVISTAMTINGPGPSLTVQRSFAANIDPFIIFYITGNNTVSISGLIIKNGFSLASGAGIRIESGFVNITNCIITDNQSLVVTGGGGIYNLQGTVTITDCTITNNHSSGDGGGIANGGTLNMNNCTVANNSTNRHGGAIYQVQGSVVLLACTIKNNSAAEGVGGGIFIAGTNSFIIRMNLISCIVADNTARTGGGIYNNGGLLSVTASTISGNSAVLPNGCCPRGGGILNAGTLNLLNSTIANNTAGENGGGIFNQTGVFEGGIMHVSASTIANNTAVGGGGGVFNSNGTFTLYSSIIAKNTGVTPDVHLGITSLGNNLIGSTSGNTGGDNAQGDLLNVDPLFELGPDSKPLLKNNGGPTQTIALLPNSPVIDRGENLLVLFTDQRGENFFRSYDNPAVSNGMGDGTDIGAFEVQRSFDLCIQSDSVNATLLFNSQTGDYLLCCGGQIYSGRGVISRRGSILTLEALNGARRLQAKLDQSSKRGTVSMQSGGAVLCTITDRDFTNNHCVCGG
jgi:hypothetical protein